MAAKFAVGQKAIQWFDSDYRDLVTILEVVKEIPGVPGSPEPSYLYWCEQRDGRCDFAAEAQLDPAPEGLKLLVMKVLGFPSNMIEK